MSNIIQKLGSYQIITNLLPGTFFFLVLKIFFKMTLSTETIGEDIIAYYFMGLIINRIGALIVEPILFKINFIKYVDYRDYIVAAKVDAKIDTLSEMNNYFRSLLTSILLIPIIQIIKVLSSKWIWFSLNCGWFIILILVVLFLFAFKKQTNYIYKRVKVEANKVV